VARPQYFFSWQTVREVAFVLPHPAGNLAVVVLVLLLLELDRTENQRKEKKREKREREWAGRQTRKLLQAESVVT
jgi:hypothetical protein